MTDFMLGFNTFYFLECFLVFYSVDSLKNTSRVQTSFYQRVYKQTIFLLAKQFVEIKSR